MNQLLSEIKVILAEQGSEEWENIRAGRFTSSEWYKLMSFGKRPMTETELKARPKTGKGSKTTQVIDITKFSDTGYTYINQKVAEVLTGKPKRPSYAYPLVYGKETEPEAVEYFEMRTGLKCEETGFQCFGDHAGGSPDRLIGDTDLLEVKCPYESENQVAYLMLTDHWDLKNNYPDKYWQIVTQLWFTGRERAHWCSFDPRMIKDEHKLTHLIIEAKDVQEDIDMCEPVLLKAIEEKLRTLNILQKSIPELKKEYNP